MLIAQILAGKGSDVVSTRPDATVAEVASLLKARRIGAVVVTDAAGGLCGIISERDLACGLADHGAKLLDLRVSQLMTADVVTCSPEDTTASYSRPSYWADTSPPFSFRSLKAQASSTSATSRLVAPAMADTTTAQWCPASASRLTCAATLRIRAMSATDVPPNFNTKSAMASFLAGWQPTIRGPAHSRDRPDTQPSY